MGRSPVIDRNHVLDVCETLVRTRGITALTIGEVAKEAGISKGGVQSAFGTKDQLVQAMFDRWNAEFESEVAALAGPQASRAALLRAHIQATHHTDSSEGDRAAAMLTALLQVSWQRQAMQRWYRERLDLADPATEEGRRARLAFLATEGTFLLRSFGFVEMTDAEWDSVFTDIAAQLPPGETA